MKKHIGFVLLLLMLMFQGMYAQKQNIYKLPIPRDIEECCEVLDVTYPDEAIKEL